MNLIPQAYANITNPAVPSYGSGDGGATLGLLIANLWRAVIVVGGLALIIFFTWGAVSWILASGDKSKIEHARDRMVQAFIGMAILAASLAIVMFFQAFFQIDLLNPQFIGPN